MTQQKRKVIALCCHTIILLSAHGTFTTCVVHLQLCLLALACHSSMKGDQSNMWVMGSHLRPGGWEGIQLQLRARCFKRLRAAKTPAVNF